MKGSPCTWLPFCRAPSASASAPTAPLRAAARTSTPTCHVPCFRPPTLDARSPTRTTLSPLPPLFLDPWVVFVALVSGDRAVTMLWPCCGRAVAVLCVYRSVYAPALFCPAAVAVDAPHGTGCRDVLDLPAPLGARGHRATPAGPTGYVLAPSTAHQTVFRWRCACPGPERAVRSTSSFSLFLSFPRVSLSLSLSLYLGLADVD